MRIYISGRITGDPEFKERFRAAEEDIKKLYPGAKIVNPSKLGEVFSSGTWGEYMDICELLLKCCDCIYMLEGWEVSQGAQREYGLARWAEMDIIFEKNVKQGIDKVAGV